MSSQKSVKTKSTEPSFNDVDDEDDESEDEDYVPSEHEVSEEENSGDEEDFDPSISNNTKKSKRKAKSDTNPRLARGKQIVDQQNVELKKQMEEEQIANKEQKEKAHADALWASFMSDVGPSKAKQQTKVNGEKIPLPTKASSEFSSKTAKSSGSVKITKVFDFAGETVRMETQVAADSKEAKQSASTESDAASSTGTKRAGGLGAVLSFINKKQKISTLDKSKLDWEKYKSETGISHELKNHTNSKASYLERKEFLERADQRQFEKERDARLATSSKR